MLLAAALAGCAAAPPRPNPPQAEKVVTLAKSLVGTPYRYGGCNPKGFDCSGLVQYVYRHAAGVQLPRTSKGQFARTVKVPLGQEAPGDLLFYDIKGSAPSHVGIYLGKGAFVHAPSTGGAVKISDGNERYWVDHFMCVRRVWD